MAAMHVPEGGEGLTRPMFFEEAMRLLFGLLLHIRTAQTAALDMNRALPEDFCWRAAKFSSGLPFFEY